MLLQKGHTSLPPSKDIVPRCYSTTSSRGSRELHCLIQTTALITCASRPNQIRIHPHKYRTMNRTTSATSRIKNRDVASYKTLQCNYSLNREVAWQPMIAARYKIVCWGWCPTSSRISLKVLAPHKARAFRHPNSNLTRLGNVNSRPRWRVK